MSNELSQNGSGEPPVDKGVPQGRPHIELPRGRVLLVGAGAFGVTALPSWAVLMRMWYGWSIRACLTHAGDQLVSRQALAAATQAPVEGPHWDTERGVTPHQELAEWPDLVIVAPATTNFVAKCALGMPDSLALSTVLATSAPVVLAPSLPAGALVRPAVQRNLRTLTEDGYHVAPMQPGTSVHKAQVGVAAGMPDINATLRFTARVLHERNAQAPAG
ncbi:flavoprotein [Streptomyces sp. NBC_01353]|uniref:flavoprotein n=1 Tax=Streptomyces sp. NBC_01353 TaxID=2903835 RepID=UPI002E307BD5|nr:flavoprotein [Streptomyces sp. NBC_01353]